MKGFIFPNAESVCYNVQNLINISRYNLKRITNDVNPKRLIFVCSCISRKVVKDFDANYSETETLICSNNSNNLTGKIKRSNENGCPFRLTFNKLENGEYKLGKKLINEHNHPAEDSEQVSYIFLFKTNYIFYISIL